MVLPVPVCLCAEDGNILWRYPTGGRIPGSPVVAGGELVFAASEDRYLYAVDTEGLLKHRIDLGFRPGAGAAAGPDGSIYVVGRSGAVSAYNPAGGRIWRSDADGTPASAPLTGSQGIVVCSTESGIISAWSHTGRPLWRRNTGNNLSAAPSLAGDSVLVVPCTNGYLYAYDIYGNELWRFLSAGQPSRPYPGYDGVACGTGYGTVFLLDGRGRLVWNISYTRPARVMFRTEDRIFVKTGTSGLRCLSTGGLELWSRGFGEDIDAVAKQGDSILVLGPSGITGLDDAGEAEFFISAPCGPGWWGSFSSGLLFHGGENWNISCVDVSGLSPQPRDISPRTGTAGGGGGYGDSTDYRYLKTAAGGDIEETAEAVIGEFEALAEGPVPGSIPPYTEEILRLLASGAVRQPIYRGQRIMNDFPLIRDRAVRLLGRYGTLETPGFLLSLLSLEWDPLVTATLISTLGALGSDPDGRVTDAVYRVLSTRGTSDLRTATAALDALEEIMLYNGGITSQSAVLICLEIYRGDYPRDLRVRASRLLSETGK